MADTLNPLECEPLKCLTDARKCQFLRSIYEQHWAELRSYHDREQQVVNWTGGILAGIAVSLCTLAGKGPFDAACGPQKYLVAVAGAALIALVTVSQLIRLGNFAERHQLVARIVCRAHWAGGAFAAGFYTEDGKPLIDVESAPRWGLELPNLLGRDLLFNADPYYAWLLVSLAGFDASLIALICRAPVLAVVTWVLVASLIGLSWAGIRWPRHVRKLRSRAKECKLYEPLLTKLRLQRASAEVVTVDLDD